MPDLTLPETGYQFLLDEMVSDKKRLSAIIADLINEVVKLRAEIAGLEAKIAAAADDVSTAGPLLAAAE